MFWSTDDAFTTELDIQDLHNRLPNVVYYEKLPVDFFHMDFLFGVDADLALYRRLGEILEENNNIQSQFKK